MEVFNGSSQTDTINLINFPNHMIYAQYKSVGQCSALILPSILLNIVGLPGIIANLLLIFVTIKDKFSSKKIL
uniref:G_PROTEIN_RECEP_F1_2 domain-containing protein n=1 Tax=Meloidogyne hapla TaxID=6305 RepID=A0A1I8BGV4_MELHA